MLARCLELHYKTVNKLKLDKRDAERSGEYRVAARLHAVLLNNDGKTSGDIAAILHAPRSCVSAWLKHYEEQGYEGLLEGHRSGRVPKLSPSETAALGDIIESGPVAYGFLSGVWTSPMITRIIREEFGQKYHPGHVRKLLAHMGFSVQRPKRLLAKADAELQHRWRRYTYPNIKKKRTTKVGTFSSKTKPVSGKTRRSIKPGRVLGTNP